MRYLEIQGERIPAIGFGTWRLTGDECREGVRHALEVGYRHIDTARMYANEAEVGRGIADSGVPREEIFLVTKLAPRTDMRADQVGPATEQSLEALGLEQIDLLLIHWPNEEVPLTETLDAMIAQKEAGRVRHIGVSNFRAPLLREALEHTPILADQVPYAPGRTQRSLRELCETHGIMLTAYSPLGRGDVANNPTLADIGTAHGKTAAQVALRWLLQQPNVVPIPRSSSPERRVANLDVLDFELSEEEMSRIFALAEEG